MIRPFQFSRLPKIIYGTGRISQLPGIVNDFGKSVILVTGKKSFLYSSMAPEIYDGFRKSGINFQGISVSGEPSVEMIDAFANHFYDQRVDVVVAIGGGSAIDTGKALSAMLYRTESVADPPV